MFKLFATWVFAFLIGCATPTAKFEKVSFDGLDLERTKWKIHIIVSNPNYISTPISGLEYKVFIENQVTALGALKEGVLIRGQNDSQVYLPLEVPHQSVAATVKNLQGKDRIRYRIEGKLSFLGIGIPFRGEGTYVIPPDLIQKLKNPASALPQQIPQEKLKNSLKKLIPR